MPILVNVLVCLSLVATVASVEVAISTVEMNLEVGAELTALAPGLTGRMNALFPSYSLRPGDDASARLGELTALARHLGFFLLEEDLIAQMEGMRSGHATPFPAAFQPTKFPAAAVPFAFQFLGSHAAAAAAVNLGADTRAVGDLVEHVRVSILNARSGLSRLLRSGGNGGGGGRGGGGDSGPLSVQGMSDASIRHLLNNLCSAPGTRYLEVGSWRGSTLTACLSGNEVNVDQAVAVDSWEVRL